MKKLLILLTAVCLLLTAGCAQKNKPENASETTDASSAALEERQTNEAEIVLSPDIFSKEVSAEQSTTTGEKQSAEATDPVQKTEKTATTNPSTTAATTTTAAAKPSTTASKPTTTTTAKPSATAAKPTTTAAKPTTTTTTKPSSTASTTVASTPTTNGSATTPQSSTASTTSGTDQPSLTLPTTYSDDKERFELPAIPLR